MFSARPPARGGVELSRRLDSVLPTENENEKKQEIYIQACVSEMVQASKSGEAVHLCVRKKASGVLTAAGG